MIRWGYEPEHYKRFPANGFLSVRAFRMHRHHHLATWCWIYICAHQAYNESEQKYYLRNNGSRWSTRTRIHIYIGVSSLPVALAPSHLTELKKRAILKAQIIFNFLMWRLNIVVAWLVRRLTGDEEHHCPKLIISTFVSVNLTKIRFSISLERNQAPNRGNGIFTSDCLPYCTHYRWSTCQTF